ncbi:MAG TPA: hypothetical protein VNM15_07380 [Candidatus Binatia bacterium]|nr:hypothetical protein [Candidatus Binatia bacterium]
MKNSLPVYQEELARRQADFEAKKELSSRDLIFSEQEVRTSERALADKRFEIARVREGIAEDDVALALAEQAAQEKLARLSELPVGGYEETARLICFNGPATWSRATVRRIGNFYRNTFHRTLPVSALGQSATHDRMGLDHREALDIAVHPNSAEGRGLIGYLKNNGIPFIAFCGTVPNMATGAHIHAGKPSPRIVEAKPAAPAEIGEKNLREARAPNRTSG